jgi:hypothetical protein
MKNKLDNDGFSNILIISLILVMLGIAGYFAYPYLSKRNTPTSISTPNQPIEEMVSLDEEYQLYKNNDLGFSIKIPKYLNYNSDCYKDKEACINSREYFSLKQLPGTNKVFLQSSNQKEEFGPNIMYFSIYKFNSKEDLQMIIKSLYGNGCLIEKIETSENGNYKELKIKGDIMNCSWWEGVKTNINLAENKIIIITWSQQAVVLMNTEIIVNTDPNTFQYKYYDGEIMDGVTFY